MFRRIDTISIRVRDLRKARNWYQQVLSFSTTSEDPAERLAVMATPEGVRFFGSRDPDGNRPEACQVLA